MVSIKFMAWTYFLNHLESFLWEFNGLEEDYFGFQRLWRFWYWTNFHKRLVFQPGSAVPHSINDFEFKASKENGCYSLRRNNDGHFGHFTIAGSNVIASAGIEVGKSLNIFSIVLM